MKVARLRAFPLTIAARMLRGAHPPEIVRLERLRTSAAEPASVPMSKAGPASDGSLDPCVSGSLSDEPDLWPVTIWKGDVTIADEIAIQFWWSPFVDAEDINVSVDAGVAKLSGTVESVAERRLAIRNAFEGGALGVIDALDEAG